MRLIWSCSSIILLHLVVILEFKEQLIRCLTVGFTSPPSSKMGGEFVAPVSSVREQEDPFLGDNRCLNNLCYFVRFLMFRVSISWVPFLFLLAFPIFSWLLIMFQSGWKPKPPELMMLRLLWILSNLTSFTSLEYSEPSLVIKAPIFAIDPCRLCSRSMGLFIGFLHPTTPKLIGKLRF